ncbi:MAG: regulatory protein RecX [Oscillospiraceae bacterium]|nr:regulatory protein RecX [Oscillospiraceae bacterium]
MKIIKLVQSRKAADIWYIELDDGGSLRVNLDIIAEFGLFTGRELDEDEVRRLKGRAEQGRLRERAMRMLSARNMSRRELTDKLVQKGEDPEAADAVARRCEALGFIDDAAYARTVAKHYCSMGYGRGKVKAELYRRGLDRELAMSVLEELPEPDETLDGLLMKKLGGRQPDRKELKKLTDSLYRRGFGWEDIRAALQRYSAVLEDEYFAD